MAFDSSRILTRQETGPTPGRQRRRATPADVNTNSGWGANRAGITLREPGAEGLIRRGADRRAFRGCATRAESSRAVAGRRLRADRVTWLTRGLGRRWSRLPFPFAAVVTLRQPWRNETEEAE